MTFSAFLFQALNGLSTASGLFFVAVGLSLIFGVTRIVNIAHGSLYMLGTYIAYSFATKIGGALGFWGGIVATALVVGAIGALIEVMLLRRIYRAPELFQLLATFALVLVINDAALWLWGPEDLLGPRAPGLRGAIEVLGRQLPSYDLFLIFIGPLVLLALHFALARTRFGRLVRAATQDREMVGALGVNQAMLFTAVFRARRGARRLRRRAAGRARAGQSRHRPGGDQRRLRGGGGRRHGLDQRGLSRRRHHRRGQSHLHRHRRGGFRLRQREFLQAHAGRRIPGDGGGADRAPLRPARPRASRGALDRRAGRADPPGDARAQGAWAGGAGAAVVPAAAGAELALFADPRHRRADRGDLRDLAAFHHGAGRHAFVRPRRLFRARRLWRGAAGEMARRADGPRARRRAFGGAGRRAAVRLVRRAALRRLSRHAHIGLSRRSSGRRCSSGRLSPAAPTA